MVNPSTHSPLPPRCLTPQNLLLPCGGLANLLIFPTLQCYLPSSKILSHLLRFFTLFHTLLHTALLLPTLLQPVGPSLTCSPITVLSLYTPMPTLVHSSTRPNTIPNSTILRQIQIYKKTFTLLCRAKCFQSEFITNVIDSEGIRVTKESDASVVSYCIKLFKFTRRLHHAANMFRIISSRVIATLKISQFHQLIKLRAEKLTKK